MVLKSVFLDHCRRGKRNNTESLVFDLIDELHSDNGELERVLNFLYAQKNETESVDAFLLSRYFGLRNEEIAKKMGVTKIAIACRVYRCKQYLKKFKRA